MLFVLALICCRQDKDNSDAIKQPIHDLCIIINKDTTALVSFTIEKTPRDGGQVVLESYNNQDTLSVSLNYPSFLLIGWNDTSNDTVLVFPTDTVYVEHKDGEISVRSHKKFIWPKIDRSVNTLTNSIDSINTILYEHTHPRMVPNYKSMTLRMVPKNPQLMESKGLLLDRLIALKIKKFRLQLNAYQKLLAEDSLLFSLYHETLRARLFLELVDLTYLKKFNVFNRLRVIDDSVLDRRYGRLYLSTYIRREIVENLVNRTKYKVHVDYGMAYDKLPEYFSGGEVLKYTRQMCLERMYSAGEGNTKMKQYFNHFCEQYNDTIYQESFKSTYFVDYSALKNARKELNLIDESGKTATLSSIIAQNHGYLLYIDFWASWCGPCRAEMPASRELKKEYNDQDIKFIYLSIDHMRKKWKNGSKAESIYTNNYLVLNYKTSLFIKDMEINSIPRYLLYDQNGTLVHGHAPRPGTEEIRELFDKYLID